MWEFSILFTCFTFNKCHTVSHFHFILNSHLARKTAKGNGRSAIKEWKAWKPLSGAAQGSQSDNQWHRPGMNWLVQMSSLSLFFLFLSHTFPFLDSAFTRAPCSSQFYWNKRNCLCKKRVQLPQVWDTNLRRDVMKTLDSVTPENSFKYPCHHFVLVETTSILKLR